MLLPLPATGRTHRYYRGGSVLFPFGYGLSYTSWRLGGVAVVPLIGRSVGVRASVMVTNIGPRSSDHSLLVFMSYNGPITATAVRPKAIVRNAGCTRALRSTDMVQALVGFEVGGPRARGEGPRAVRGCKGWRACASVSGIRTCPAPHALHPRAPCSAPVYLPPAPRCASPSSCTYSKATPPPRGTALGTPRRHAASTRFALARTSRWRPRWRSHHEAATPLRGALHGQKDQSSAF